MTLPEQTYKYGEDSDETLNQMTKTTDLISWSLQIARGIDFLASKKVTILAIVCKLQFKLLRCSQKGSSR
jgi:hypothetical protein